MQCEPIFSFDPGLPFEEKNERARSILWLGYEYGVISASQADAMKGQLGPEAIDALFPRLLEIQEEVHKMVDALIGRVESNILAGNDVDYYGDNREILRSAMRLGVLSDDEANDIYMLFDLDFNEAVQSVRNVVGRVRRVLISSN